MFHQLINYLFSLVQWLAVARTHLIIPMDSTQLKPNLILICICISLLFTNIAGLIGSQKKRYCCVVFFLLLLFAFELSRRALIWKLNDWGSRGRLEWREASPRVMRAWDLPIRLPTLFSFLLSFYQLAFLFLSFHFRLLNF